jgi:hypothetical protein
MREVVWLELVLAALCPSAGQLSHNIVTEEVKSRVVKTKYGRVQGFISKVGRDAATSDFVQVFLGIPYASPPTGNYRSGFVQSCGIPAELFTNLTPLPSAQNSRICQRCSNSCLAGRPLHEIVCLP